MGLGPSRATKPREDEPYTGGERSSAERNILEGTAGSSRPSLKRSGECCRMLRVSCQPGGLLLNAPDLAGTSPKARTDCQQVFAGNLQSHKHHYPTCVEASKEVSLSPSSHLGSQQVLLRSLTQSLHPHKASPSPLPPPSQINEIPPSLHQYLFLPSSVVLGSMCTKSG